MNGAGHDDVVVARYLEGGVDLYLGSPSGLGRVPAGSDHGFPSFAVALGDRDNDGDRDLAVATGEGRCAAASA